MRNKIRLGLIVLAMAMNGVAGQAETELGVILKKSAAYCERLRVAAFHCICKEHVAEVIKDVKGRRTKKTYVYDYQLMGRAGQAEETRTLLQVNGVDQEPLKDVALQTEFYSHLSVYAPVFLLARENQGQYRYQLLKKERLKGVRTWVLDVEPAAGEPGVRMHGRVWIDPKDFSVLCIEVNPMALGGYQKTRDKARSWGAEASITDTHWYEVRHDGLRFPSRTEFHEKYLFDVYNPIAPESFVLGRFMMGQSRNGWTWNRSTTTFIYQGYHFFQVQMEVSERVLEK